ncbi:MAG: OmpA family protein, partial [Cyclobacteriaceae bacterium]|nr:OmpA family protein [Cyclobacteriaceae bacterium]
MPRLIGVLVTGLLLNACVSQKQYDDLWSQKAALEVSNTQYSDKLSQTAMKVDSLETALASLSQDHSSANDQLASLNNQYKDLLANNDEINQEYLAQQQRIVELEKILEEKEKAVNELKGKVSNALLNFKENDLTVEIKNGKVYVSLAEQLLFGSGSIKVDQKGIQAIRQLAEVLNDNPDINIVVEGHTDNVPVSKTGPYMKDNWDLSVMRATSIVNILKEAGVQPQRITASGKGEYAPVTSNEADDGRRKNRRTEIILTPQL